MRAGIVPCLYDATRLVATRQIVKLTDIKQRIAKQYRSDRAGTLGLVFLAIAINAVLFLSLHGWQGVPWKEAKNLPASIGSVGSWGSGQNDADNAIALLDTSDEMMFEQAVYALERLGEEAVPSLLEELKDEDISGKKRVNIVYALGRLGPKAREAVPALLPFLGSPEPDLRAVAAIALGKIGDPSAIPAISPLADDDSRWVRKSAAGALKLLEMAR